MPHGEPFCKVRRAATGLQVAGHDLAAGDAVVGVVGAAVGLAALMVAVPSGRPFEIVVFAVVELEASLFLSGPRFPIGARMYSRGPFTSPQEPNKVDRV